ncbi:MAG: endonuclease/exonuclease/phosphatase family protein [Candidatus Eremiobacterota bacterium]
MQSVVTRHSPRALSTLGTYPPGPFSSGRTVCPASVRAVTLVSVYGMIEVYSQTTMLRIVADLIPVFDSPFGEHVILGGDFNVPACTAPSDSERRRYDAILQAVEALGLTNLAQLDLPDRPPPRPLCPCGQNPCRQLATYRGTSDVPFGQIDYLFATSELARRCRRVAVEDHRSRGLSDHAPVIADFDVTEGRNPKKGACHSSSRVES